MNKLYILAYNLYLWDERFDKNACEIYTYVSIIWCKTYILATMIQKICFQLLGQVDLIPLRSIRWAVSDHKQIYIQIAFHEPEIS